MELDPAFAVYREALENSLYLFVREGFKIVEPQTEFVDGWHIEAICDHLQAISDGRIKRLIINVPPRSMKSLIVSVFFPAWEWTTKPHMRYLTGSYSGVLSMRDAVKTRRLISSPWYQRLWGDRFQMAGDQNVKGRYENTATGHRITTSTDSFATGEGGDRVIIDDPLNASDAESQVVREGVNEWFDGTMTTRLNDPKNGAFVIVMQRLHENDLTGHLMERGGWEHLCIPAEFEINHPTLSKTSLVWVDPRKYEGELLWGKRMGVNELNALKVAMGSRIAAGQLQQRPTAAEGDIIKKNWIKWYTEMPKFDEITISVDLAFKGSESSDRCAIGVFGMVGVNHYLIEGNLFLAGYTEQKATLKACIERYRNSIVIIEDKANGSAIIDELKQSFNNIIPIGKDKDKMSYLSACAPMIEAGQLYLPNNTEGREWANELTGFPRVKYDDAVDATSQYLNRQRRGGGDFKLPIIRNRNTSALSGKW
jgi:predicted phage terminase large subunit-like protein